MSLQLSRGTLEPLFTNAPVGLKSTQILRLQLDEVRPIGNAAERYKAILGDGLFSVPCVISRQVSENVSRWLHSGTVIDTNEFMISMIEQRKVFVLLKCAVVGENPICGISTFPNTIPTMSANQRGGHNGHPDMRPAHGVDRFYEEYKQGGQMNNSQNRVPVVGRSGENPGTFAMQSNTGFSSSGPVVRTDAMEASTPISALNPYTNRWMIIARCTAKAEVRRFTNKNGDSQVFSFDLIDSQRGEIRCTCFGETVDRLFPVIEVGQIYRVEKGNLKKRSKYCHLDHEYEIRLDMGSTVERLPEQYGGPEIPFLHYNFKTIDMVQSLETNSILDVLGVISRSEPIRTITKKNGDEAHKKTVSIKDQTGYEVDLVLWDDQAINIGTEIDHLLQDGQTHLIAVKGVRVVEFNGVSLSTLANSSVQLNPDVEPANNLRQWAMRYGTSIAVQSLRQPMFDKNRKRSVLADITLNSLQQNTPSYFTVCATVTYIKATPMYYPACPLQRNGKNCLKKLIGADRNFSCEACGKDVEQANWRYILSMQIRDHTDNRFVTAFDVAEEIMGISAQDLRLVEGTPAYQDYIENARFRTKIFTLKAIMETWNDDMRIRLTVIRQEDINFAEETNHLLDIIERYGCPTDHGAGSSTQPPRGFFNQSSSHPATPQCTGYDPHGFLQQNMRQ